MDHCYIRINWGNFFDISVPIFDTINCACPNSTISKTVKSILAIYIFLFLTKIPSQPSSGLPKHLKESIENFKSNDKLFRQSRLC